MKTKKYQRKIIVLAVVLSSFGALLYLQNLQKRKENSQQDSREAGATDKPRFVNSNQRPLVLLPAWDSEVVTAIAIDRQPTEELGEASYLKLEKLPTDLAGAETAWKLSSPVGIPTKARALENLGRLALSLAGKQLQEDFDLSKETLQERYGFHKAWLSIDYLGSGVSSADRELIARMLVGSEVPGIGGYYVTAVQGEGLQALEGSSSSRLFRISTAQIRALAVDANDLRNQQLPELTLLSNQQDYLETLELRSRSNVLRIEYKNGKLAKKYSTLNELQSFVMMKPYPTVQGVDQYQLEKLLKTMPNPVRIIRYVEDEPKDLKVYGLAKNQRQEIYASDNKKRSLNLWLGREADKDSVYAMEAGYESVFTVSKKVLAVLNFEPFQIADKFVILVNIAKIDRVRLLTKKQNYNFQILHKVSSGDQNKIDIHGSKLQELNKRQERNLNEDLSKDLYQEFLSIFFAGEVSASFFPVEKAEVSMIYLFRNGDRRSADFYNYSAKGYYVVSIDGGKATFVTEKRQVDQLLDSINRVLEVGQLNVLQ